MKRTVFISALFLLGTTISSASLPNDNKLIASNHTNLLKVKSAFFSRNIFNTVFLHEQNNFFLLPANKSKQNSETKIQFIQSSPFLLEERNSKIKTTQQKKHYRRKKAAKHKSLIIHPHSNLIKVPP